MPVYAYGARKTGAQRVAEYRRRLREGAPPPEQLHCSSCGAPHRGAHGNICRGCWRKTPEGRAHLAERARLRRKRIAAG